MQRRIFMITSAVMGLAPYLGAPESTSEYKRFVRVKPLIAAVQAHMFPQGGTLPSARQMRTIDFTEAAIFHPTYDRDIRAFVIEGAEVLDTREKGKFLTYTFTQKEEALRNYEAIRHGGNWLARIMTLTMEALFSDPVYGSNLHENSWKAVSSFGGQPRPTVRYIAL